MSKSKKKETFRFWTEFEIRYIKKYYRTKSSASIARTLSRSQDAVQLKAKKLGIAVAAAPSWSAVEMQYLTENFPNPNISLAQIAEHLGRTKKGVERMASLRGLKRLGWRWTQEEKQFFKKNYDKMTYAEFGKKFGVSAPSITNLAKQLGLKKKVNDKRWTEEENNFLLANIGTKTYGELAKQLQRTELSVFSHARYLRAKRLALEEKKQP